jgi:hypothetical protein
MVRASHEDSGEQEAMQGIEVQMNQEPEDFVENQPELVTQLQREVNERQECFMSFNDEITRRNEIETYLSKENDELKSEIAKCLESLRDNELLLKKKCDEHAQALSVKEELEDQVHELESQTRDLKRGNEILKDKLEAESQANEFVELKVKLQQSKIEEKDGIINWLRSEAKRQVRDISSLKREAKQKKHEFESIKQEALKTRELQRTVALLAREMQRKNQEVEALKREVLKAREAQRTVDELKEELERYRQAEERHSRELEDAQSREEQAKQDRQNLLQKLESQIVGRRDPMGEGLFPNGRQIERKIRECQELSKDFFVDLAYHKSTRPVVEDYEVVFENIFLPCTMNSMEKAAAFQETKRSQLASFLEDNHNALRHPNTLVSLLATSSMQRIIQRYTMLAPEVVLGDEYETYKERIQQACSEEIESEIDYPQVTQHMKGLFDLCLYCRFSEPSCYMSPIAGTAVKFSRSQHSQLLNQSFRQKARSGDIVTVLYPGLYYKDPASDPNAKPITKAVVVLFSKGFVTPRPMELLPH